MKKCRTCGRAVGEWKFCQFCGTPLDVTELSYQKTGTLLRHNVVFSEDVPPQHETATAMTQNNTSGQPKNSVTTDIYSSSFEAEKIHDETLSSKQQKPCKEITESAVTKEEPLKEKIAPLHVLSVEPTDKPEPQPEESTYNTIENYTSNNETEYQTATETQEPETPLNIGSLFSFASQTNYETKEDKSTEPQTQGELPEIPLENNLEQPVDDAVEGNANDGFSQIDFDAFDTDEFDDDQIETDTQEDDSQIDPTPIYEPVEPIEQETPIFETSNHTAQEETTFDTVEPITQEEQTFEQAEPFAQEEQTFEQTEPFAQKEQTIEQAEPVVQEEPTFEQAEPFAQEEQTFEQVEPVVQEKPSFEQAEPVVQEEQTFEHAKPVSPEEQIFEPVEQTVPITEPEISVSEIDPMFGAAPSFDIESIKASFDAKKTDSKKRPKKGLFNRKK